MSKNKDNPAKIKDDKTVITPVIEPPKVEQPPVQQPPVIEQDVVKELTKSERIKLKAQAELDKWKQEAIDRTPEPEEVEEEE